MIGQTFKTRSGKIVRVLKLHKSYNSLYEAVIVTTNTPIVIASENLFPTH
jgi:hypothetical protein